MNRCVRRLRCEKDVFHSVLSIVGMKRFSSAAGQGKWSQSRRKVREKGERPWIGDCINGAAGQVGDLDIALPYNTGKRGGEEVGGRVFPLGMGAAPMEKAPPDIRRGLVWC